MVLLLQQNRLCVAAALSELMFGLFPCVLTPVYTIDALRQVCGASVPVLYELMFRNFVVVQLNVPLSLLLALTLPLTAVDTLATALSYSYVTVKGRSQRRSTTKPLKVSATKRVQPTMTAAA